MLLAGRAALNRLEPFARDRYVGTSYLWADRLAGYYDQQGDWEGVAALIAEYPCGSDWGPWNEDWQMDYVIATAGGSVVVASENEWLDRTLNRWELDRAAPIVVNDEQVGLLLLFPFDHFRPGHPSIVGRA